MVLTLQYLVVRGHCAHRDPGHRSSRAEAEFVASSIKQVNEGSSSGVDAIPLWLAVAVVELCTTAKDKAVCEITLFISANRAQLYLAHDCSCVCYFLRGGFFPHERDAWRRCQGMGPCTVGWSGKELAERDSESNVESA